MILISPDRLPEKGITLSDAQRRRLEAAGTFPLRVQISARSHGYVEAEIDRYVTDRINARRRVVTGAEMVAA